LGQLYGAVARGRLSGEAVDGSAAKAFVVAMASASRRGVDCGARQRADYAGWQGVELGTRADANRAAHDATPHRQHIVN